jgi:hypothetical protein
MKRILTLIGLITLMALSSPAPADPIAPSPSEHSDATVRSLIVKVHDAALKVNIDGNADDWADIPSFPGTSAPCSDPSRKITRFAIAPLKYGLLLMIRTQVRPTTDPYAFWVNVDYMGNHNDDIQVGLGANGEGTLWIFEPGKPNVQKSIAGLSVAVGDVVEALIPYSSLDAQLPSDMQITDPHPDHPWIRVAPFTYYTSTHQFVDYGPAVASYRLIPDAYLLDPPAPAPGPIAASISLPLIGKWWVAQGAFTQGTHKGLWAYDLVIIDAIGSLYRVRDSHSNDDSYSWNQPIIAPADGTVYFVRADTPDHPPSSDGDIAANLNPNQVALQLRTGIIVGVWHCKQDSIEVGLGDTVKAGREIARVGDSGTSSDPHLHLECFDESWEHGVPFKLQNVTVSINPDENDPWRRVESSWQPCEGYFVENTPSQNPH